MPADLEAIAALKARYWQSIDNHLWTEAAGCFSADATADYPDRQLAGRTEIAAYLEDALGRGPLTHQGSHPHISITGPDTARGTWEAEVSVIDTARNKATKLRTSYEDVYVKDRGAWYIKSTRMRIIG